MTFTWDLPTSITGFNDLLLYFNTATNGWGMTLVLATAMIIMWITLSRFPSADANIATTIIGLLLAIPLYFAGLISSFVLFAIFGLLVLSILAGFFFD